MLSVRSFLVNKNNGRRREVRWVLVQPRVDVLRPCRNDASVMARCRDFLGRSLIDYNKLVRPDADL